LETGKPASGRGGDRAHGRENLKRWGEERNSPCEKEGIGEKRETLSGEVIKRTILPGYGRTVGGGEGEDVGSSRNRIETKIQQGNKK